MKVKREEFLALLTEATIGLSKKEILEQSNCFIFHKGLVLTFNDEIFFSCESPLDFDAIVPAEDLLKILTRLPDEEIDVRLESNEMILEGKRRDVGITVEAELHLPFDAVPSPGKWLRLTPDLPGMLQQAARTCGSDETQYKTTCVHVTPDLVEASDNYRIFRADLQTGFNSEILIPASSINTLSKIILKRVNVGEGWVHFTTGARRLISIRCSHETYHEGIEEMLVVEGTEISLPKNLGEMIGRAEVMNITGYDARISLTIHENLLQIMSQKDGGWFREKKRIKYSGERLRFDVHPQFMAEVLERTHKIIIGSSKLKLEAEGIQFVVSLDMEDTGDIPF